ncbi:MULTISPECIES: flagellin lysine-N-methylase [unclassified Citrobacter]|uniref:flagellin lysine-N-methylase n=1 Tax=unclassified Citrobacter TaxID=2644389 RepID=UPI001BA40532|nr:MULTISPECIES: flagellin lysine-N-methylase [unclassified Citrobacter]MDM2993238.1 flagellin lysine-N-methylase [Citrobacter sp. CK195]MDM3130643.1 flagellin lysine-N-methylase [Citrobacter sp. CK205]HBC8589284.1 flagellin lysine-N-methylase [Citrobacter koseri]
MKQIIVTQPKLVADFSCVGGECREHCCQGWTIVFDKSSVNRYVNSRDSSIRRIAKTGIKITKKHYQHWGEVIFQTESKGCPFMDAERLCSIHSTMGAQALSPTCSTFPRTSRIYKNEVEKSLNLSCPEVTRLLLSDKDSMSMMESTGVQQDYNNAPLLDMKIKVINLFCQNIFNVTDVSVEEQIYTMVKFLMVAEKVDSIEESISDLENVYRALVNELVSGKVLTELQNFNQNYSLKFALISLMQGYFTKKMSSRGGRVLNHYFTQLYGHFDATGDTVSAESTMRKIEAEWCDVAENYLKDNEHLFKNFFKYKLWQQGFPQNNGRSMLNNLYLIVAEFYFIKTLLAGHVMATGKIEQDNIVDVIYSFHSLSQHNQDVQQLFHQQIESVRLGDDLSLLQLLI